jgi:chromosome partitioning protein
MGENLRVWTIANQKGGVGKTTTAVALAGIAAEAGERVLLIDMDPHGSLTAYFRMNPDHLDASTYSLFEQRKNLSLDIIGQLLVPTGHSGIQLMPASVQLATLERQAIGEGMGLVLKKALAIVADDFDKVMIDCPPQLGVLLVNALAACERIIIPVQTEFLAIKGLDRILNTLNMMGRSRKTIFPHTIVPVMFDRRTQASVSSLRVLRNQYGENVWPGRIPIDTRLRDASKAGIPPSAYDASTHSVDAYRSLYKYLNVEQRMEQVS